MNNIILLLCFALWLTTSESGSLRYCLPKLTINGFNGLSHACNKLQSSQNEIQCVIAPDRLSCFNLLAIGKADFMVAEPEDLIVIGSNMDTKISVTHILKKFSDLTPQLNVEMIAVVKAEFFGSHPTKGRKLCYLGLGASHVTQFDYYYNSYFESWLFARSCDSNMSLLENRLSSLAKYFDSACIAGPWSLDRALDAQLKTKYKNLCALCSNPHTCSEEDLYYGMNGALTCLRQGAGEVAWLNRGETWRFFAQLTSHGYALLCPDGNFVSLVGSQINSTCTWVADPRPVIVAKRDMAARVHEIVTDRGEAGSNFYEVIHSSYKFSYLLRLTKPEDVMDYIKQLPGFYSAAFKAQTTCRAARNVRWCVASSLEARKCQMLQAAAGAVGLGPSFTCVNAHKRDECVRAVRAGRCDVYVARPDEVQQAKELGVTPIVELLANKKDEANSIAAVVRKQSKYRSFADLRGAKACFTGYRSPGWNAFFSILKDMSEDWNCKDTEAVSRFFKDSCVFGLEASGGKYPKNLHSLCKKKDNKELNAEERTFECLTEGADVAFVNVSAAKAYATHFSVFNTNFRLLCPTARIKDNREPCYLAKASLGSVLVRDDVAKIRKDDIYQLFLALNRYFGRTFDRETPMFKMYLPFEGESNVIFPENTMKLQETIPDLNYGRPDKHSEVDKPCKIETGDSNALTSAPTVIYLIMCSHYVYRLQLFAL